MLFGEGVQVDYSDYIMYLIFCCFLKIGLKPPSDISTDEHAQY